MPRKDYAPTPLQKPMSDEELARAKDRQKVFSLTGSGLGLSGLGLLGASVATKRGLKKPVTAHRLKNASVNTGITAGGVGALSGINFARIQGEESRRTREIKKANYGAGYSSWDNPDSVDTWESTPTPKREKKKDWREKSPYTISRKAANPERSREGRARMYPAAMGAGAVGAGALGVSEALKDKKPKSKFIDQRVLNSKTLRVGVPAAAAAGLAAGAVYNSKDKNRRSYEGEWYPQRERVNKNLPRALRDGSVNLERWSPGRQYALKRIKAHNFGKLAEKDKATGQHHAWLTARMGNNFRNGSREALKDATTKYPRKSERQVKIDVARFNLKNK